MTSLGIFPGNLSSNSARWIILRRVASDTECLSSAFGCGRGNGGFGLGAYSARCAALGFDRLEELVIFELSR
jgi:hypothetical protein